MTQSEIMSKLLEISENSYFRWKKKDHVILINFLEKYFTKEDLEEFVTNGKIERMDKLKEMDFQKDKILNKFFFEYYTHKSINAEFAKEIFPKFEEYIENLDEKINSDLEKAGRKINASKFIFFNKSYFIDFVMQSDFNNPSRIILTIAETNEVEFFIIMTNYKSFLEKQTF